MMIVRMDVAARSRERFRIRPADRDDRQPGNRQPWNDFFGHTIFRKEKVPDKRDLMVCVNVTWARNAACFAVPVTRQIRPRRWSFMAGDNACTAPSRTEGCDEHNRPIPYWRAPERNSPGTCAAGRGGRGLRFAQPLGGLFGIGAVHALCCHGKTPCAYLVGTGDSGRRCVLGAW